MKDIYFIRHAKSSWSSSAKRDFDRPLNKRGKRDAPFMAQLLAEKVNQIDGVLRSPSKRTTDTSSHFIKQFNISSDYVLDEQRIYHGSVVDILEAVHSLPIDWQSAMVFGHNPGMTYIVHHFGIVEILNVPTCGILHVRSHSDEWGFVVPGNSELLNFYYPKQYFGA